MSLNAASLQEMLQQRSKSSATWLILPEDPLRSDAARRLSFSDIYGASLRVASGLAALGGEPGRVVGIVADNDDQFVVLFFGSVLAGLVPAPLHLPAFSTSFDEYVARIAYVLSETNAQFLTVADEFGSVAAAIAKLGSSKAATYQSLAAAAAEPTLKPRHAQPHDLALVQFSSGSTRTPLGAMLTHSNILHNVDAIGRLIAVTESDVDLCWLPLFHDMGLTGAFLYSWYWGPPLVLMKPQDFVFNPASWLWAISRFGVRTCPAPNFAYAVCSSKTKLPDSRLEGLDLRQWRLAFNGAEPVQARTIARFVERFAPYGFREEAMYPVYGLAENVLAACFPPCGRKPKVDWIDRRVLGEPRRADRVDERAASARSVVSVGGPLPGQQTRIARSDGTPAEEREVGEVQLSGPCVMKGYYGRASETANAFTADGWLRTGDLGYFAEQELYILGREKELIKKAGAKYDACDIQDLVAGVPGARAGSIAAFGVESTSRGTEDLVIIVETVPQPNHVLDELRSEIRRRVSGVFSVVVDLVELVPPGTLPKSSSGKIRILECRRRYLEGQLDFLGRST